MDRFNPEDIERRYEFEVDDVDRLFARLRPAEPPVGLSLQVLAAVSARARRRRRIGAWMALASLVMIALFSFLAGQQLATSGSLLVLQSLVSNLDLVMEAPADAALAAIQLVPWAYAALVVVGLAAVGLAARMLFHPTSKLMLSRPQERS